MSKVKKNAVAKNEALADILDLLKLNNFEIQDFNRKKHHVVISYHNIPVLVSLLDNNVVQIEISIYFDADLINLKTLSSVASVAYKGGLSVSGLSRGRDGLVKFYISKDFPLASFFMIAEKEIAIMVASVASIRSYLQYRVESSMMKSVDLSMFKGKDLSLISPVRLGEKKDFLYITWDKMKESLSEEPDAEVRAILGDIIESCKEFEAKNSLLLSEVGEQVTEELEWNEQISKSLKDDYSVN